jgi:hypothetical protein
MIGVPLTLVLACAPIGAGAQTVNQRPAMDPGKLKAMLINVPTGSPLRVRTRDGVEVAGKPTELSNDGLQMQALVNGNIENRSMTFSEISGLKTGAQKTGPMAKLSPVLTIIGLVGTAGALTAAIRK